MLLLRTRPLWSYLCLLSSPSSSIPDMCYYQSNELHCLSASESSSTPPTPQGLSVTCEIRWRCAWQTPNPYRFPDWFLSQQDISEWEIDKPESIRTNTGMISIGILSVIREKTLGPWHLAQSLWKMQKSIPPDTEVQKIAETLRE